jgi:hypothetical protein
MGCSDAIHGWMDDGTDGWTDGQDGWKASRRP